MPKYYARGISMNLSVQPLRDTITPSIVLRKGEAASKASQAAEQQLLLSEPLREERVFFPGDARGFGMNWLGDAPFMQVQAGREYFEGDEDDDLESSAAKKDSPLSLSLHVQLDEKSFASGLNPDNKVHLKIDVFVNGQLSNCSFVPYYEVKTKVKSFHQVFAGSRVDVLAERPWVLLPPGTCPNGAKRYTSTLPSVTQRWSDVSEALLKEANSRGTDIDGDRPPSAKFLSALVEMAMPRQVADMQTHGSTKMGVIDVIVTAGNGKKLTSGMAYLKRPQRLEDENFPYLPEGVERIYQIEEEVETGGDLQHNRPGEEAEEGEMEAHRSPKRKAATYESLPDFLKLESHREPFVEHATTGLTFHSVPSFAPPSMPSALADAYQKPTMPVNYSGGAFDQHAAFTDRPASGEVVCESHDDSASINNFFSSNNELPEFPSTVHGSSFSDSIQGQHATSSLSDFTAAKSQTSMSDPLSSSWLDPPAWLSGVPTQDEDLPGQSRQATYPDPTLYGHIDSTPTYPVYPRSISALESVTSPTNAMPAFKQGQDPFPTYSPYTRQHISIDRAWPPSVYSSNYQKPQALPPKGLFSVTTKPRPSLSPTRSPSRKHDKSARSGFTITRLLITGKGGSVVIDHRFKDPKKGKIPGSKRLPNQQLNAEMKVIPRDITAAPAQLALPSQWKNDTDDLIRESHVAGTELNTADQDDQQCEGKTHNITETLAVTTISNSAIENAGKRSTDRKEADDEGVTSAARGKSQTVPREGQSSGNLIHPETSQNRPLNSGILGVPGPKATHVWLEDPEEVVREAARLRREKSKQKLASKDAAVPEEATPLTPMSSSATPSGKVDKEASSSPLSSLTKTPELIENPNTNKSVPVREIQTTGDKFMEKIETNQPMAAPNTPARGAEVNVAAPSSPLSSLTNTPESLNSFGFRKRTPVAAPSTSYNSQASSSQASDPSKRNVAVPVSRKNHTPSPSKPAAQSTPRFTPKQPSTPQPSASPNSKKRKAPALPFKKQPRSPDRLKTTSNPPLNQDCVVAFAESANKGAKQGVLRQVKGERQGVFSEEYVVFAARFFVAGT